MASPYLPATITVSNPPRGSGTQPTTVINATSVRGTFSWGSAPGRATLTYVPPAGAIGVATGSLAVLNIGAHYFTGMCISDTANIETGGGALRTLEFVDLRDFFAWDWLFCAFNKPDIRLINGVRVKRYKHMYPDDYDSWTWTYTFSPLTAYQILGAILNANTVGSPWSADLTGGGEFPGGVLNMPIYDFDCLESKRLDQVLSELAQRSGTVFTLSANAAAPYETVWTRKGANPLLNVVFPEDSDNQRAGVALSGNATNVAILGDRNKYQLMDIDLVADWAPAWQQFLVFELFADYIYQNDTDPLTGIAFKATPSDPEQYIGRQLATARALTITLREFVDLTGNNAFADYRKYAGRWRMDMPCALYLQAIVFRAFKPDFATLTNVYGKQVPLSSMDIADQLLCRVSHNPADGTMQFFPLEPVDSNGYVIVKGYQVGKDLFQQIKPEQFSVDFFSDPKRSWQGISFQIDDSGEGVRFVIADEPVIVSSDILVDVDGNKVINATFTLTVPPVKAALVFEAERFKYWQGTYPNVSRDHVENTNGLHYEGVLQNGTATEIVYADGQTANYKASLIANFILIRQYTYAEGGFKNIWDGQSDPKTFGTALSSLVDRVMPVMNPEGLTEEVDFTNERQRDAFEPEREFERKNMQNTLFPGQQALRMQAETARKIAAGFRQMPFLPKLLSSLLNGSLGSTAPLQTVWLNPNGKNALTGVTLPVGTVIRKTPTTAAKGTQSTNTIATAPSNVAAADTVFVGVTVRHGEDATKPFNVQQTGEVPVRVMGPVNENDSLGLAAPGTGDNTYLVKGGTPSVGTARQKITSAVVQTIKVNLGAGGSSSDEDYAGIYVPGQSYDTDEWVVVQNGAANGGFVSTMDGNTNDPATGIGWVQFSYSPQWF